jgi:hypothetical protein
MAGVALIAACAPRPDVERDLGTSTRDARIALELAVEDGPVAGSVTGLGAARGRDVEARLLAVMADAVPALSVRFTTDATAPASPRLVVRHGLPRGANPCTVSQSEPGSRRVTAAFCEQDTAIGAVHGELEGVDDGARTRLYRRLARALFPDLYAERYGIGSGPFRVNVFGNFGF